jgi:hypothetical protein
MKKSNVFLSGLLVILLAMGLVLAGCDIGSDTGGNNSGGNNSGNNNSGGNNSGGNNSGGNNSGGNNTGGNDNGAGSSANNAKTITVGYSSSHTISSSGQHWFKFTGTGDPVIFETTGNVVDTYMEVWDDYANASDTSASYRTKYHDNNSGDGSNALCSFTTTSGKNYWIRVTAYSSTSGEYTFVIKAPTSNLRTNPITVSVGNASSHTIYWNGTHWFMFTGTGERVFFETEGSVVNTSMSIFIGNNTNSSYQYYNRYSFITVSGTTYYINITGNSGTYTFIVRNGTGNGSSVYNAIEVTNGYSSSHTITSSGAHWFMYYGTGNKITFKTTGNVVDTYMEVWDRYDYAIDSTASYHTKYDNDNGGDGSNALCSFTTTSGTTYWIKVTARSSTSGEYTFIVE